MIPVMRKLLFLTLLLLILIACTNEPGLMKANNSSQMMQFNDTNDMTNNFYDNTETHSFIVKELTIDGEIANPGKADFTGLQKRSVIVKETLLDSTGGNRFTGAFRYDGYSMFDILDNQIIKKENAEEYSSIIDLYVEVENDEGDKVVLSWGEIYYPNNLHRIIIATDVSRIVPSKTNDLWELPEKSKLVAASDLITERNISNPVRISVKSFPKSYKMNRGMSPMYSPEIKLFKDGKAVGEMVSVPEVIKDETFSAIFYGRGRGIHTTMPFTGPMLKEILLKYYPLTRENIKSGIMCIAGVDGYRCALSYSELFNRNDQQEFLLIESKPGEDGGLFRMFAACDFFSDRAVKSINEIHLGF